MLYSDWPLTGIRFLIIEDEMLQALALKEMLKDMGGTVTDAVFGYEEARHLMHKDDFDCALLDVNLNGTLSFPIADELNERAVPFVFCTGFADAIDAYPGASQTSVIDKPVQPEQLLNAVLSAVSR